MKNIGHGGGQHAEGDRSNYDLQDPFPWWRCMKKRGPIFRDPLVLSAVVVQVRLDAELQIAPILLIEGNEPKGLLVGRHRAQHLGLAEYRSRVAEEHHSGPDIRIQRSSQGEHAARGGNNLQIACHAAPILASENGRRGSCQVHSCSALRREDLGEAFHAGASM